MSIVLHPDQSVVFNELMVEKRHRYSAVCCSRGWGKSYLGAAAGATAAIELTELPWNVPNKNVFIIAPTYDQVTDIYYPILAYDYGFDDLAIKCSKDDGRFILPNNSELRLLSYEAVERMRGKGCYFAVWDEVSSCKRGIKPREAWDSVIKPTIVTRWSKARAKMFGAKSPGRALIISTPKGYNFFYDMYNFRESDKNWKSYRFDYNSSPLLEAEEIESERAKMDPIEFASEYLADFKESGNRVFYCFDRGLHVRDDLPYFVSPSGNRDGEDVHVNIDFNVGLQCSSAFALRGGQMHFLDEFKGHPDTLTLALVLKEKYKGHKIYAYPDPSGRARKTSAPVGITDFKILEAHGITCLARPKAPPIVDSVQAVNRMLLTAKHEVRMFFRPHLTGTITSIERTKWVDNNPDLAVIDKSEGIEHFSDGVRYGTDWLFPVEAGNKVVISGHNF
jgi:hypothetical protein